MSRKFRCGRLLQTKDGRLKKLDLGNGGGTRSCDWFDDNMTFDDVHQQLLTVFCLTDQKNRTSLYDFKHQPLDVQQYSTFADYMKQHGLNRNSTVVYLCTSEVAHGVSKPANVQKNTDHLSVPTPVKTEPIPALAEDYRSPSSSEYSFADAVLDLMKNMRELISQSPSNKILAQLFENLCLIHGHVFAIILPLQQLNEHSNESERILYLHNLNNVYDIFESTKKLLDRNHRRFLQIQLFSIVQTAFLEFYQQLQSLRDRWTKSSEKKESVDMNSSSSDNATTTAKKPSKSSTKKSRRSQQLDTIKTFSALLSVLQYLLRLTRPRGLSSFQTFIEKTIHRVRSIRKGLDLSDQSSIDDAKAALISIKSQLADKQREVQSDTTTSRSDRTFHRTHASSIRVIRSVLTSLYTKQAKMARQHQQTTPKKT